MKTVFEIFQKLKRESPTVGDSFVISTLPKIKNHKLGISKYGQPIFFIKCESNPKLKVLDTDLEFISVQFNRQCQLINQGNKIEEGIYTIISLKADIEYLQHYFLKIVFVLVSNLTEKPVLKELKIEVDKLINLFSKISKPALKAIQGLWAELLVIEQSKEPDYLIQSWHSSTFDKYDFNDGFDKVEVKSTTTNRRIHSFSREQLCPNVGSNLIIVSIYTIEVGTGINVFDLIEAIESKVQDKNLCFRLNELVALTLGRDFEKSSDVFFDYSLAVDSIRFYNSIDIPTISATSIPAIIINVRFDCDITAVKKYRSGSINSKLLNSLL